MNFQTILRIIRGAPAVIAQAPAFKELFDQVVTVFKPGEQEQLKSAYQQARQRSDEAQADFTKAGRGQ